MLSLCHTFIKANQTISYNTTAHTRQPLKSRCLKTTIFGTKSFAVPYVVLNLGILFLHVYFFSRESDRLFQSPRGNSQVTDREINIEVDTLEDPGGVAASNESRMSLRSPTRWETKLLFLPCPNYFHHFKAFSNTSPHNLLYLICCQVYQCFFFLCWMWIRIQWRRV